MSASPAGSARAIPKLAFPGRRRSAAWPLRGPGSIFAKGLRDSRRAILIAGVGLGLTILATGASVATYYPTVASRLASVAADEQARGFSSLFGEPIGVDRLGGLVSYNETSFLAVLLGLWSMLALSGTLAGEARSRSLEILAGAPISRRRIACEKLGVHLAGLGAAVLIMAACVWLTGALFATLPGDGMAFSDALVEVAGWAMLGLVGGAIAFALGPFLGRGLSAGVAAAVFFGAFIVNAYSGLVPLFGSVRALSWFSWTTRQQPLAGSWDPLSLVGLAGLVAVLLAAGVLAFERRDFDSEVRLPRLGLPGRAMLLRGPAGLGFLSSRSMAIACGLGLGLAVGLVALASESLVAATKADPGSEAFVEQVFGAADWTTARGLLQLCFAWFGYLIMALVAAVLVGRLASDERERRLDLVLSTSLSRTRWLIGGGAGIYACIALLTLVVGLASAAGSAGAGQDAVGPFLGAWAGGLYAAALAGLGLAVLGLGRAELAAAVPAAFAIVMYVWDSLASILRLPWELTTLSLTHHLGRPMAGVWDWPGMALLLALAVGLPMLGALALRGRDLST